MVNICNLMVGDWVKTNPSCGKLSCGIKSSIAMVSEIRFSNSDGMYVSLVGIEGRYYDDELEPILLTKEILEKTGFILNENETNECGCKVYQLIIPILDSDVPEDTIETFNVIFDEDDNNPEITYLDILVDFPIKYVHELQHVLKMCGINKKIMP